MIPDARRRAWMLMLAKQVYPLDAPKAGKALADLLPFLDDLPEEAFCDASLRWAGQSLKGVPTLSALRSELCSFLRSRQPELPAISHTPPARPEAVTDGDKEAVARVVAAFVSERSWNRPGASLTVAAKVEAAPLSDWALLATWERAAALGARGAEIRIEMLRRKLGIEAAVPA